MDCCGECMVNVEGWCGRVVKWKCRVGVGSRVVCI